MTNQTFTGIDLTDGDPPGICSKCAENGIEHLPSGVVFVYCQHHETGAFRRPDGAWATAEGIGFYSFKRQIVAAVLQVEINAVEAAIASKPSDSCIQ